jgi:cytolysin-activating lysine-acyltransferase
MVDELRAMPTEANAPSGDGAGAATVTTPRGTEAPAAQSALQRNLPPPTFASRLGEMVWLLSQSPAHRHLTIGDLEWMLMPPLLLEQYKIYYESAQPAALALWAYLNPEDEQRLLSGVNRLKPEAWCGGDRRQLLAPSAGKAIPPYGATQLWLVDLIAPRSTPENRLREKVLADLVGTVFTGRHFKFHVTDPTTGGRRVQEIAAEISGGSVQ